MKAFIQSRMAAGKVFFYQMSKFWRRFLREEDGMGTIEIVIIIAVLVGIAFLFNSFINDFFQDITQGIRSNTQMDKLFKK